MHMYTLYNNNNKAYQHSAFTIQVIDIQPNDGFGTLLPLETLNIDIIFSATNPKVGYNYLQHGSSSCVY